MAVKSAGRRTKQRFESANRTGYLNLDTYQTYTYNSTKMQLDQIKRDNDNAQKADYSYDTDGHVTKALYGNGAGATYYPEHQTVDSKDMIHRAA